MAVKMCRNFVDTSLFCDLSVVILMKLHCKHNEKIFFCRNATLELLTDRRDKDLRSGHSNPRHAAFENLVLSMELDGQTLSEVSSLHTGSFYSQYDERLQVAVTSHSSTGEVSLIIFSGIHISSRQVVRDDYKVLQTSIKNHKLVWWTSKFQGANFSLISTSHLVIQYCSEQKINIL